MRKTIFFFFFFLVAKFSFTQVNLVPNPSFEDTVSCPFDGGIYHAVGWSNAGGTPDYFNSCCGSISPDFSVPNNWGGYQLAASGNAYSAVGTYEVYPPFIDVREFIISGLTSPMVIGNSYIISFKINLSLRDTMYFNLASDKMGALLSTVPYSVSNPAPVNNFAHIYTTSIITDTMNWTTISGVILADSAYQYILIGNFFDDLNTDTLVFTSDTYQTAYYYIDDVSVTLDTASGVEQSELLQQFNFINNNDGTILVQSHSQLSTDVHIYDLMGQQSAQRIFSPYESYTFNLFEASAGIYVIELENKETRVTRKILLTK